jgi:hypothetical protein
MSDLSMIPERLHGPFLKIDRAIQHFEFLQAQMDAFAESEAASVRTEVDREARCYTLWITQEKPIPLEWSVIIGDVAHNLRSALDHLVWQLALLNLEGRRAPGDIYFPIYSDPDKYATSDVRKRLGRDLAGTHLARVEEFHVNRRRDELWHALRFLNALSRIDKHRSLQLVSAMLPNIRLKLTPEPRMIKTVTEYVHRGPLKQNAETELLRLRILDLEPAVNVQPELTFDIEFSEGAADRRLQVTPILGTVGESVTYVLESFIDVFA